MMESEAISNFVHQFVCSAKAKVLMSKSVQHEHTALYSSRLILSGHREVLHNSTL